MGDYKTCNYMEEQRKSIRPNSISSPSTKHNSDQDNIINYCKSHKGVVRISAPGIPNGFQKGKRHLRSHLHSEKITADSTSNESFFYLVFADLTAAFDKMCRSFSWRSIYQRLPETFDKTNFQILENLDTKLQQKWTY